MYGPELPLPLFLEIPQTPALSFGGFKAEAFEILDRLRQEPHIEQYRKEKHSIQQYIQHPFKVFRDDLVLNWVVPNQLPFETERNVFSRLLKNDFGAGGCHHHLWLSFYRHGLRRLTDLQLAHSLSPDGFSTGLYVGDNAPALLKYTQSIIQEYPNEYLRLVNTLLAQGGWVLRVRPRKSPKGSHESYDVPLHEIPASLLTASGIWLSIECARREVLNDHIELVNATLDALHKLWPVYLFLLGYAGHKGPDNEIR